ncbi:hypothetical protein [Acidihalobacter prosperus]
MQRPGTILKTLSVRVNNHRAKVHSRVMFEVNLAWSFTNELSDEAWHISVQGWI